MPGISRHRPSLGPDQWVSLTKFNLWRRHPFEPASRTIVRGTVFMVAILILLGYTAYTIAHGLNPATMYGRSSFRRTGLAGITPQPHLFTNHCTSAMMPGVDQNAFASLISVGQLCDDGSSWGSGIQQIADCIPVWYNVNGWDRDISVFRDFHGENGGPTEGTNATSTCLVFECPSCHNKSNHLYLYATYISLSFPPIMNLNGTSIWNPAATKLGHIGSTAIWPWNNVSNPNNGRNPRTGERRCMPKDITRTPFLARN